MSALSIQPTYPIFTDIDGQPLEDGYIFIGAANLNPQTNPIIVYQNAALTTVAVQPIRTRGGYPVFSGTPGRLYVNSDYSIQVQNKNGSVVYSAPAATERYSDVVVSGVNAEDVIYDPPFFGGVQTNVEEKLAQTVSVLDYGAVADWNGTTGTDNSAAFTTAFNSGNSVYIPKGQYMISSTVTIQSQQGIKIFGAGADATQIAWNGANDGVMFTIVGTRHSLWEDFQMTGNFKAGTQLQIIQPDLTYLYTNTGNTYRNLRLGNNFPASVKPIIQLNSPGFIQVDVQNFYDLKLENATKMVTQESNVTLAIMFVGCHFQAYLATCTTTRAIDLMLGGNTSFVCCTFVGQATEAIIYVHKTFGLVAITNCETEIIGSGSFLYAEDDTSISGNTDPITITGSTLGFDGTAGINWIDYQRVGNLIITGCKINSTNAVNLNVQPSNVAAFIENGNRYINVNLTLQANSRICGYASNGNIRATSRVGNIYGAGQPLSGVMETKRANTVDNTLSRITGIGTGGGSANVQQCVQTATGISTVAASIALLEDGSLILVRGSDGVGNDFLDLVISTNSGTPTVITSKTLTGSPAARTYSTSSFQLFLAMASGTYATNIMWFGLTAR